MTEPLLSDLLRKADGLAQQGHFQAAAKILVELIEKEPDHIDALTILSRVYRADKKPDLARSCLVKLSQINPSDPWVWNDLGGLYEENSDFGRAANAYLNAWSLNRANARFALNAGYSFWRDEKPAQALNVWSLGSDLDPLVRTAQFRQEADKESRMKSNVADTELRRHFTQMYQGDLQKHGNPKRLRSAIWPQTHFGDVNYQIDDQKPYMFYAPDLPACPVFETSKLSWAETLKTATPDIKDELQTYLNRTNDYGRPYLAHVSDGDESWRALQGNEDWNALHLFKDAQEQECLKNFPKTSAALSEVPLVNLNGTPMEVFFSVLKPHTHIPPHFGLSNSRCTAHLPLIIPDKCEIRVSDQIHHWQEGELFLFDDSFDHEAQNDSDDIRIVLILETWRPDLTAVEIDTLQNSMETRASWLNDRQIPKSKFD